MRRKSIQQGNQQSRSKGRGGGVNGFWIDQGGKHKVNGLLITNCQLDLPVDLGTSPYSPVGATHESTINNVSHTQRIQFSRA